MHQRHQQNSEDISAASMQATVMLAAEQAVPQQQQQGLHQSKVASINIFVAIHSQEYRQQNNVGNKAEIAATRGTYVNRSLDAKRSRNANNRSANLHQ
jgi:hypothetical protein